MLLLGVQVGKLAGQLVSAAFPAVMDLKFERVCQPFMMLHVNRYNTISCNPPQQLQVTGIGVLCPASTQLTWACLLFMGLPMKVQYDSTAYCLYLSINRPVGR